VAEAKNILILSDVHYAGDAERARGATEATGVKNPLVRWLVRLWRGVVWLREPFAHNYQLDELLARAGDPDWVVANGDYSCDSAFIGLCDLPARESARECLGKLRARFGERLLMTIGDHELGKTNLTGRGGMRLESWRVTTGEMGLPTIWEKRVGRFVLIGVTSSLIGLEILRADILVEEWAEWQRLRAEHMAQLRMIFEGIGREERIILFCHDPTALPFLAEETWMQARFNQLERTVVGHLHTPLIFWKTRLLAGFPPIRFAGKGIHRISRGLNRARAWKPFKALLCPSLAGSELLKDGGFYTLKLPENGPAEFTRHRLPWKEIGR
jgi:hypothetical protein